MRHLHGQLRRLQAQSWLILVVTALTTLACLVLAPSASYSATASLITTSPNRTPEQDGVLATGYVDLFVEPSVQEAIRAKASLPSDVILTARIATSSPIIYVTAQASDAEVAVNAAKSAAQAFSAMVNSAIEASTTASVERLRKSTQQVPLGRDAKDSLEIQVANKVGDILTNSANLLQELQSPQSATKLPSAKLRMTLLGLLGGLFLGSSLALARGFFGRRVDSDYDLREKAGMDALSVVPAASQRLGHAQRAEAIEHLATSVALAMDHAPAVVALTRLSQDPYSRTPDGLARAIAAHRARQGVSTILVRLAGGSGGGPATGTPILDGSFVISAPNSSGFREVFPVGRVANDPGSLGVELVTALVDSLKNLGDLIVIDSPPADSPEARMVCVAADRTLLVVEVGVTSERITATNRLLRAGGVRLHGVVLLGQGSGGDDDAAPGSDPWSHDVPQRGEFSQHPTRGQDSWSAGMDRDDYARVQQRVER